MALRDGRKERKRLGLKRVAEGAVMPWVRGIVAALTKESEFGLLGVGWKTAGCATLARVTLVLVLFYSLCTEDFLQPSHGRGRDIASGKISLEACGYGWSENPKPEPEKPEP